MNPEAVVGYFNEGEMCVVCGKRLHPGEALATLHHGENRLPVCCPLCLEAYQKDPKPYLTRLAEQIWFDELRKRGAGP